MDWTWKPNHRAADTSAPKGVVDANKPELRLTVRFEDGDGREFQIPACGGGHGGVPFQWKIDWGDGARGFASGASSARGGDVSSGGLVHKYAAPGTYVIALYPASQVNETTGDMPGWLQAFGYPRSWAYDMNEGSPTFPKGGDKLVGVDGILDDRAINIELDDACSMMFTNCTNISMGPGFTFSSNKERAGDYFCFGMFERCSGSAFTMGESFQLPQNLRTVGRAFCCRMFMCCGGPSFSMNDVFTIPQGITSAGSSFCQEMFEEHGLGLTMGKAFNLPQGLTKAEDNFCGHMFSTPRGDGYRFEMNGVFNLPQRITGYVGKNFCNGMFWGHRGPSFSMNGNFNIPRGITGAGDAFCKQMFQDCSGAGFSMNDIFNLPERLGNAGAECCMYMFMRCSGDGFKLNEAFDFPTGLMAAEFLAYQMFNRCRWSALNRNVQDVIAGNPHLHIWEQAL